MKGKNIHHMAALEQDKQKLIFHVLKSVKCNGATLPLIN
jgi:hypothetical protein